MKEIIQIHIGQSGIQIGMEIWELLCKERQFGKDGFMIQSQQQSLNVSNESMLFNETPKQQLVPRCLFIDTDPNTIDQIKTSEYKNLFNPRNLIKGKESTSDNFSEAHYCSGRELVDKSLEQIRREAEKCNSFQGFILNHSIMGGTGSGFMSLLLERISVDYGKKSKIQFPIIPSKYVQNVVGYYNSVLCLPAMLEHNDLTICLDNEALYNCLDQEDELDVIQYKDINRLIAQLQSSLLTCSQSGDLKELATNLVPYPRIHFAVGSAQPLNPSYSQQNIGTMISKVFKSKNQFLTSNPERGASFGSAIFCRGLIAPSQVIQQLEAHKIQQRTVGYIPNIYKVFYSSLNSYLIQDDNIQKVKSSIAAVQNNSCFSSNLDELSHKFDKLYAKRAFLFWYYGVGMESGEFSECRENIAALLKDYEEIQIETDVEIDGNDEIDQFN